MPDQPTSPPSPPPPPPRRTLLGVFLFFSLAFNLLFVLLLFIGVLLAAAATSGGSDKNLREHQLLGNPNVGDKIAVVYLEGVILEGTLDYVYKQLHQAAKDDGVKAVVLRVNSPGGSITASDQLHRRLRELRDGSNERATAAKPLVVSMGSLAASGGYYVAMPSKHILAERTTVTGSIGVYSALPNVSELTKKIGVDMVVLKRGEVKDSGSPFHPMSEQERLVWQDMVDHAYRQFLEVVEEGRPALKGKLREVVRLETTAKLEDATLPPGDRATYERRRADGGIFTAHQALQLGLIDKLGYLEDAVREAVKLAGLGEEEWRAVRYERPTTLMDLLVEGKARPPEARLDLTRLGPAFTPRLWYLMPQADLAGIWAAAEREGRP